ncbi:MAG TPA: type II secretion system F family protein, partial [Usitatibacter sp.]|nr:type II secretion system F family protein [Usitatibacter sp.]
AMLYRAGISVLDCIQICEKIVGNRVMEEGLQRVGRSISEGQGISLAFTATKLFPPLVLRMLRVGESTGALDAALLNVSYFYNRQVRDGIARMQALLGPMTTVILGMLIVGILYSIFLPIYDVIGKIKF